MAEASAINNKPEQAGADSGSKPLEGQASPVFSSYARITACAILQTLGAKTTGELLARTVCDPKRPEHHLLSVPKILIIAGILLEHAKAYQSHVEKQFVDYVVSGQQDKPEDAPGASVREKLAEERQQMEALSRELAEAEQALQSLISRSQQATIQLAKNMDELAEHPETLEQLDVYQAEAVQLQQVLDQNQSAFRELIVRVSADLSLLPDYFQNEEALLQELQSLNFDTSIGH